MKGSVTSDICDQKLSSPSSVDSSSDGGVTLKSSKSSWSLSMSSLFTISTAENRGAIKKNWVESKNVNKSG